MIRTFSIIIFCLLGSPLFPFAYPYERMELIKELEKEVDSLFITKYTPLKSEDRIFSDSYWKIYYQKDKIVGEELFVKGKLSYYYVYFYQKDKITQKGFLWYGIYRTIMSAKLGEKTIKQGYFYKDIPDSYKVFSADSLKLTYRYTYPNKEI